MIIFMSFYEKNISKQFLSQLGYLEYIFEEQLVRYSSYTLYKKYISR